MKINWILLFLLFAVPGTVWAGCGSNKCTAEVTRLILWENGSVSIAMNLTSNEKSQVTNCTYNYYVTLNKNHELFDHIYATLLVAKRDASVVSIRFVDGGSCSVSYIDY